MASEDSEYLVTLRQLLRLRADVSKVFREGLGDELEDHIHEFGPDATGRLLVAHVEAEVDSQLKAQEMERKRGRLS